MCTYFSILKMLFEYEDTASHLHFILCANKQQLFTISSKFVESASLNSAKELPDTCLALPVYTSSMPTKPKTLF